MCRASATTATRSLPSAAGLVLLPLFALLPFEPRWPALRLPGMQLTVLEAVALWTVPLVAWSQRDALLRLLRRPPLPLVLLSGFAFAHLLSAVLAEPPRFLPLKASLRMLACASFAFVTAALPYTHQRRASKALAWGTILVGALAIAEGAGVRALDPFLDLFREAAVFVGDTRRATAASEHPNLAAALLVSGLVIWSGLSSSPVRLLPAVALLSGGLLLTYSRGGLAAAALALCVLAFARGSSAWPWRNQAFGLALMASSCGLFAMTSQTFRLRLYGESPSHWFIARYRPSAASLRLAPSESRAFPVEVENAGQARWRAAHGMALGQRWVEATTLAVQQGNATRLPYDLDPGQRTNVLMALQAPREPGRYQLLFDLTHDGQRWLSEAGVPPGSVGVLVSVGPQEEAVPPPDEMPEALLPRYWQPDRAEFARLAFAMWRDRPLTGVGSDNFRRLHVQYAGRHLDVLASAGNAFLETAATTGVLGLLAFLGTLAVSLGAAIASLRNAAPASDAAAWAALLLALLVAVLLQDCVDYFLVATGHYLFFGFIVGALSTRDG